MCRVRNRLRYTQLNCKRARLLASLPDKIMHILSRTLNIRNVMLTCDVHTCIATFRIMDANQPCGSAKKNSESLKFSVFEKRRLILPSICDL